MSYSLHIEFTGTTSLEAVTEWVDAVRVTMPEDATVTVKRDETVFAAEKLDDEHIGSRVRFALPHGGEVTGKLDAVFPHTKTNEAARVLVVDGTAYVLTYALVHVSD